MQMANMDISPEDREMLAKTKFKQWFNECFDETFGNAFDGRFNDVASLGGSGAAGSGSGTSTTTSSGKTAEDSNGKRRSLLSMSLEQALGL
jgi:hypothetical protein